jgi:PAS domain S-box-containing protein
VTRKLQERRARLEEAEDLLRAVPSGKADALVSGAEHPYRLMVEALTDGAILLTANGTILYSNHSFAAMLETPLDEVIGSTMSRFVLADDEPHYKALIRQAGAATTRGEVRLKRASADALSVILSISSFDSASPGLSAIVTDLTEHKLHQTLIAAEALERTRRAEAESRQRRIADILERVPAAFFSVDYGWRIVDVNQRAAEYLGKTREELVGHVLWDVSREGTVPELDETYRRAMTERIVLHCESRSPAGLEKWFEWHIYPVDEGLAALCCDITERKAAEETLRRSAVRLAEAQRIRPITNRKLAEDKLRRNEALLAEGQRISQTGSWVLNVKTGELSWSAEHYRIWGVDPDVAPTLEATLLFIHPEDRDTVSNALDTALRERSDLELEFRIIRPDGATRQMFSVGRPLFDQAGRFVEYAGTVMDVTNRKAEDAARDELRRRLIGAQEDERRLIALEMHDQFGQQLSALVLKLSELKRAVGRRASYADSLESLQRMAKQLDRDLEHIVGRLRPTALDDLGLVAAVGHYSKHWSDDYHIPVEVHASGMEPTRLTNELGTALYRIIQESLNNVAKHAQATCVSILLDQRSERISVIIEDDGVGFDAEQPDTTRQRFGLIGMRERATLLGGRLDIESHPGTGTTVVARIPLSLGVDPNRP